VFPDSGGNFCSLIHCNDNARPAATGGCTGNCNLWLPLRPTTRLLGSNPSTLVQKDTPVGNCSGHFCRVLLGWCVLREQAAWIGCLLQHTPVSAAPCTQCHRGIPSPTHSLFCATLTASKAFRAATCGFRDDALHFLYSANIWLNSSWCVCWLHLLRVSCFRLRPSLSRGCQRCETAVIRIHGCELSLPLSHSLSQLSCLARCLSQSCSLPLSFPLFLLFCLSLSFGWVIG